MTGRVEVAAGAGQVRRREVALLVDMEPVLGVRRQASEIDHHGDGVRRRLRECHGPADVVVARLGRGRARRLDLRHRHVLHVPAGLHADELDLDVPDLSLPMLSQLTAASAIDAMTTARTRKTTRAREHAGSSFRSVLSLTARQSMRGGPFAE
jgi:hypothetical protein